MTPAADPNQSRHQTSALKSMAHWLELVGLTLSTFDSAQPEMSNLGCAAAVCQQQRIMAYLHSAPFKRFGRLNTEDVDRFQGGDRPLNGGSRLETATSPYACSGRM